MKKIFYLLFVFPLLFSCGDNSSDDATPSAKAQAQEPKELGYKKYIEINDYASYSSFNDGYFKADFETIENFMKTYGFPNEIKENGYSISYYWYGLRKINIKDYSFYENGDYIVPYFNEFNGSRYVYEDIEIEAHSRGIDIYDDWFLRSINETVQDNRTIIKNKNDIKGYSEDLF